VKAEANRQMVEYQSMPDKERVGLAFSMGINYVESLIALHPNMGDSADAIFASIILGSWTAFECLASDLWAIGVDKGPKTVAACLFLSNRLERGEDNLTLEKLASLDSDIRVSPGSFLKEVGRVSFQRLDQIVKFYSIAFGDEYKKVFDDTAVGYIFALSSIRNVLTHRSGIADRKFVDKISGRFPEFDQAKVNYPLLLDGQIVSKLRMAAAEVGAELITRIDSLLLANTVA
jgi:hypothetical protein